MGAGFPVVAGKPSVRLMVISTMTSTHHHERVDRISVCPVSHLMVGLCSSIPSGQSGSREVSLLSGLVPVSVSAGSDGVLLSVSLGQQAGSSTQFLRGQENVWPMSYLVVSQF